MANQNPYNRLLIEYVKQLQNLNDIDVEIPKVDIDEVINDPQKYARDFAEATFVKHYKDFFDAYKIGKEFAIKNKNG